MRMCQSVTLLFQILDKKIFNFYLELFIDRSFIYNKEISLKYHVYIMNEYLYMQLLRSLSHQHLKHENQELVVTLIQINL